MRTTFGSFNIATSGLFASQRSLDITSHNISNANTEGYSRQIALQRATMPIYGDPTGVIGTGVETYDVIRMRSSYLDYKYWGQNKIYREWSVKQSHLEEMEGIFNEPSETGIRKVMDEFFTALEELSKKAGDSTCRVAVIEKANTLAATINRNGHELINAIRDANFAVKNKVSEINSLSEQIANLNKNIYSFELGGNKANDLRDQRNLLLDKLSGIINISVLEMPDGNGNSYLDVKIGGITLINHISYNKLTTEDEPVTGITELGGGKISHVVWDGVDGQRVSIEGGELRGLLDIRDGDGEQFRYRGLPYYLNKLNEFARCFTIEFNKQHALGIDDLGGNGGNFFNVPPSPEVVNSINFSVDPAIIANPSLIAAAAEEVPDDIEGESDNGNVLKLIDFRKRTDIFGTVEGTPDDFIKSLLSALSVDCSQAERMTVNSEALVNQTVNKRLSESGVSLDEEMTNMIKFQQAYNAAARMITTLDKVLDTTVNRLGIVGR